MTALKKTKQRTAMLALFETAQEPLCAEFIYQQLKKTFPSLAFSTVYRNLEQFISASILKKETFHDGVARYSLSSNHGHYLICTGCHTKIRIDDCPLQAMEQTLKEDTGFEIDRHDLTLYGKCPNCQK